jgi:hypothetical protein
MWTLLGRVVRSFASRSDYAVGQVREASGTSATGSKTAARMQQDVAQTRTRNCREPYETPVPRSLDGRN